MQIFSSGHYASVTPEYDIYSRDMIYIIESFSEQWYAIVIIDHDELILFLTFEKNKFKHSTSVIQLSVDLKEQKGKNN
jgi:hypothetical protein